MEMPTGYEIVKQLAKDVADLEHRCEVLEELMREKDATIHLLVSLLATDAKDAAETADE